MPDYVDRHDPIGKSDYLSIQHVERYRFAMAHLRPGRLVMDIACGGGYGTAMLLRYGCKVIGIDDDEQAISTVKSIYKHGNFAVADALGLPFKEASFDAIVSFETIEHVADGSRFLSEMHRVLRPGGLFICSTPNIHYTGHPIYHLKEYEPEEFYKLVQQWFPQMERHGQYIKPLDRLRDLFRWQVRRRMAALLDWLGIKEMLKRLLQRRAPAGDNLSHEEALEKIFKEPPNPDYQVGPFRGSKLLRIMVVLAKK